MLGPDVSGYLIIAAFLFATGALGVLIRRSPLIVLLSLEIMLNGANLALIAFSRHFGHGDGQIFALAVMAVAASEVVVGLGLIVAMARRRLDARRRQALDPARLDDSPPPGSACSCRSARPALITLCGNAISRRAAGLDRDALRASARSRRAVVAFVAMLGRDARAPLRASRPRGRG